MKFKENPCVGTDETGPFRFCTLAEPDSLSRPSIPFTVKYWESVDCVRYLGVSISKDLTWNTHIKEILSKANRTLGFVKRNVKTKNQPVKELAYKTFVRPKVEHASTVWSLYTDKHIDQIEMVQRRAARWV